MVEADLDKQLLTIKDLLNKYDAAASQIESFDQALQMLAQMLLHAHEDAATVKTLVVERDELQHEFDGVIYKMQMLAKERNDLNQRIQLLQDSGKLQKQLR